MGNVRQNATYNASGMLTNLQTGTPNASDGIATTVKSDAYSYNNADASLTQHTISVLGNTAYTYSYQYDNKGNITKITRVNAGSSKSINYTYDAANQLVREDNQIAGYSWAMTYDNAGNMTSRKKYSYTTGTLGAVLLTQDFTYGKDGWGDVLTKINSANVLSDATGNILSDGTAYYTWKNGRQLATLIKGGVTWTFTYDANGLRTERTNGSTTYRYTYDGSKLTQMTVGSNALIFTYGINGQPMSVNYNGTDYYYITNALGDVVGILNSSGTEVVTYAYDAWGNLISTSGSMAYTLGDLNPLRYRGYVYDRETGLYYLQSRYYNPAICRFISADAFVSTGQDILGYNMFAYCLNNPANMADPDGKCCRFLGFLWKIDCKQASCPDSKNYVKPKGVDPIGTFNKGQGYVYIVTESQLYLMENREKNVVVILDKRTSFDPNMQVLDSYRIIKTSQQREIAQLMLSYNTSNPVNPAWSRTLGSLVEEWQLHNFAYFWGIKRSQTADCDFNNADEDMGFWDFVGR